MLREMTATSAALLVGTANAARTCAGDPLLQPLELVFLAGAVGAAVLAAVTLLLACTRVLAKRENPAPGLVSQTPG